MNARLLSVVLALAGLTAVAAQGVPPPPPPPPPPAIFVQRDAPARPQVGASSVAGQVVVNDAVAQPIRRVILVLTGGDLVIARQTTTDDQGHFLFAALPPGRYMLQAWRNGFVRDYYGNKRPGVGAGSAIVVADKERVSITMKMTRGAVITGTILNANSQSVSSARVQVLQYQNIAGERRLVPAYAGGVSPNGGPGGSVDDRGVFRLYGLPPGSYVIAAMFYGAPETRPVLPAEVQWAQAQFQSASSAASPGPAAPPPARPAGYAPVFYPGTVDPAQASLITVVAGEERTNVDFSVQQVPVAKIDGVIVTPGGQPPQNVQAVLVPSSPVSLSLGSSTSARVGTDGKFTISSVTPGRYTLQARATDRGTGGPVMGSGSGGGAPVERSAPSLWASADIDVDGSDIANLVVPLQPGVNVSGRVAFDGRPPLPDASRTRLTLVSIQANGMNAMASGAQVNADGTFTIAGVAPGKYRLAAFAAATTGGASWTPQSAMAEGHDLLDVALEVRAGQPVAGLVVSFTDRVTELSGTLLDAANRPSSDLLIVAFSTDRASWSPGSRRVAQARPSNTGAFTIAALPAGEYYLAALADFDAGQLGDPAFLELVARSATKITLADGEKRVQDLKIVGGGRP